MNQFKWKYMKSTNVQDVYDEESGKLRKIREDIKHMRQAMFNMHKQGDKSSYFSIKKKLDKLIEDE